MSFIQSLILGILQGITEFFPISSSAHLKLLKLTFNINNIHDHFFDLVCHLGTICASIIFLKKDIYLLFTKEKKKLFYITLAILPLIPTYFFLKTFIEYSNQPKFLGFFLIFSGLLLFCAGSFHQKITYNNSSHHKKAKDVLIIGIMQSLSLISGISRSGSTISTACILKWNVQEAIKFSFLLAIPTILGGSILESLNFIRLSNIQNLLPISNYFIGFISSFIFGSFSIRIIFAITNKKKLKFFAIYCLLLGIISLIYLNFFIL